MFPPTIKSREIHKLTEGNSVFHLVTITFRVRGMKSANVTKHYASKIFKKMTSLMSISEFLSHIHTFLSAMVVAWQWSEHILVIAAHTFRFCLLFERSCSRKYPKWLIIYHVMILKKGNNWFLPLLHFYKCVFGYFCRLLCLLLRHFHPLTGQLCMAWSVAALLYFVARSVLLRCSWQEPLPLTCPARRHWEALQLLFNITTCWCQWLTGLTIDPSHHIKVSISAAEFIVGPHPERAELSTALGDARKSDKCWNHFKGANSALSPF